MENTTKIMHTDCAGKGEGKEEFHDIRVGGYDGKTDKAECMLSLFDQEEGVRYRLLRESGDFCNAYGTPCPYCYTLVIEDADGSVALPDIVREREAARRFFLLFAEAGVPSVAAREVAEELLARGFPAAKS